MAPKLEAAFWGRGTSGKGGNTCNFALYIIADESFYAENNDGHISVTIHNAWSDFNTTQGVEETIERSNLTFKRNECSLLYFEINRRYAGTNLSVSITVSSDSFTETYSLDASSGYVQYQNVTPLNINFVDVGSSPTFDEQRTISFTKSQMLGNYDASVFFVIGGSGPSGSKYSTTIINQSEIGGTWKWTPTSSVYGPYSTGDKLYCSFIFLLTNTLGYPVGISIMSGDFGFPSSVKPIVEEFNIYDANEYYDQFGVYVASKSSIKGSWTVKGIYGSKIAAVNKYYFGINQRLTIPYQYLPDPTVYEVDDSDYNNVSPQSGSQTFGLTVTDTRGHTSDKYEVPLTVVPYVAPTMTVQANRWETGSSIESDGSTTVRLVCAGEVPSINNHLVTGTITVKARRKNDAEWTSVGTVSISGTFEEVFTIADQSLDHIYEYQAEIVDEFGTSVMGSSEVGTSTPILEFHSGGMGVGIGTVAPEHGLNIGMNLHVVGNANDGYSRIQISDTDQENSMLLANLAGGTLRIIDPVTGTVDRAFVGGHIMMDNDKAIGSVLSSGGQFPIIRMNGSDQVELSWTSGGLKGRVMKKLWSGSMGANGSATISELPYYRIFAARLDNGGLLLLGAMSEGRTNLSCGTVHMSGTQTQVMSASFRVSGNKLTYVAGGTNRVYDGHEFIFRNCIEIWGVL